MSRRILIHHPGSNHLAYHLVASLERYGHACRFETGYFYRESGALERLARRLPAGPRGRVERELKRRFHPGIDPASVRLRPLPELAYVLINRLGIAPERLARVVGWRNDMFDRAVARGLRRDPPELAIGHDGSALFTQAAARAAGVPTVLNQVVGHVEAALAIFKEEARRAPQFAETLPLLPEAIIERHRREIATADRILVPSDYVRDTLVARGAEAARLHVLPYGVDVERFRPAPRGERRGFRMLFVGTLSQRKGISYLLEAVKRLNLPDAELVLAGKVVGPPEALAPWRDVFRHVAHVPYHEVHRLYQDADVFVYPSLHEGSAFAAFEALASGLPVVCTPNTGSVVRDGIEGFLVPIRDVDALMDRIARLHGDPDLRARMGTAARARAEDFTWARYAERLNGFVEGVPGRDQPRP